MVYNISDVLVMYVCMYILFFFTDYRLPRYRVSCIVFYVLYGMVLYGMVYISHSPPSTLRVILIYSYPDSWSCSLLAGLFFIILLLSFEFLFLGLCFELELELEFYTSITDYHTYMCKSHLTPHPPFSFADYYITGKGAWLVD